MDPRPCDPRPMHGAKRAASVALLMTLVACAATGDGGRDGGGLPAGRGAPPAPTPAAPTARLATTAGPIRLSAWATGTLEVFVNGVPAGRSGGPGELVVVPAALLAEEENVVVLRATAGAAASPALVAEVHGAFGRAGTTTRWKVKAAAGSEGTDATGPWAQPGFDDATWSAASELSASPPAGFPADGPARGIWDGARSPTVLARLRLYVPGAQSAGLPPGFGHATTGGLGGAVVRPGTLAELATALCGSVSGGVCTDATPRIVEITKEFDFTGSDGPRSGPGCYGYSLCADSTRSELLLDSLGQCPAGRSTFTVDYDGAGVTPLLVGSNKTLLGVGSGAVLRGKGLKIGGGTAATISNVIVRNVTITGLNPRVVWGGDAISLDGADRVWIDHDRISLVGRQMLVSGFGKATNVTISWNELDGRTPYAPYCDGAHYWVALHLGKGETTTWLGNWIHHTSGRGPHVGGYADVDVVMHLVNNAWEDVTGHAINPMSTTTAPQARVLAEGNHFARVKQPVLLDGNPGLVYAPIADTTSFPIAFGRPCRANVASPAPSSGWPPPLDAAALTAVASAAAGSVPAAFPAAQVPNVVPHLAGVGHLADAPVVPGFGLAASPSSVTLTRGATAATTVTVVPTNGFASVVTLGAARLPPGVTATFAPASTSGASTATFTAAADAAAGTSFVRISADVGGLTGGVTVPVTVSVPGWPPDPGVKPQPVTPDPTPVPTASPSPDPTSVPTASPSPDPAPVPSAAPSAGPNAAPAPAATVDGPTVVHAGCMTAGDGGNAAVAVLAALLLAVGRARRRGDRL